MFVIDISAIIAVAIRIRARRRNEMDVVRVVGVVRVVCDMGEPFQPAGVAQKVGF
jgi:hypothetical protein